MQKGFYKVGHAPRWTGYSDMGSGGVVFSDVSEWSEFDGLIGYFDPRMLELTEARRDSSKIPKGKESIWTSHVGAKDIFSQVHDQGPEYSIPLIFSTRELTRGFRHSLGNHEYFASFFSDGEVQAIQNGDVLKHMRALTFRRYGDLEFMDAFSSRKLGIRVIRSDEDLKDPDMALEDIPLYLLHTKKSDMERIIKDQNEMHSEMYESDRRHARAWSELGHKVVGAEG